MIGEEWGLVGVAMAVLLYLLLILIGFRIASRAPDLFGQLVAVGLTSMIAMQAILHMAVGLGLVPATGLALPLIFLRTLELAGHAGVPGDSHEHLAG